MREGDQKCGPAMSPNVRDLLNAGMYIFALAVLVGGLVLSAGLVAERMTASSVTQTIASNVDSDEERTPTRLSLAVDSAREIRAALTKPTPPLSPLPPIAAKLAYGQLKKGKSLALHLPKIPKAGLDAMALIDTQNYSPARNYSPAQVDLHRVY